MTERLGHEPVVNDLFDTYDREADLLFTKADYEPGIVCFRNLIHTVGQWVDDLSHIFSTAQQFPVDVREIFRANIVQDEPAINRDIDYKAVYAEQIELTRAMYNATWVQDHTFAKSHESPGVMAADVWAAFARTLWPQVQSGRADDWSDFNRVIFRRSKSWGEFLATPAAKEKWWTFQVAQWTRQEQVGSSDIGEA